MHSLPAAAVSIAVALLALLMPIERPGAQETAIPDVVTRGLDSLVAGSRTGAVRAWGESWTGDDTLQTGNLLGSLEKIGELLGTPQGYDLARLFDVSPNLRHVYIVIRYGKQPLYAHFIAYRPSSTWQVIHVTWNTDPSQVFPESLLIPRG